MLASIAIDPQCVESFSVLISHIINNQLPVEAKAMLTSSSLVALGKKGGGVRPIAIGELFYRIAAQYAMKLVAPDVKSVLGPHQYGVQTPNGAAQVIHAIQHLLQSGDLACLSIDIANAFNSLERAAIFDALYREPALKPIWNIAQFAYTHPSVLVLRERLRATQENRLHTILSDNGVRQGDPLAALLFALDVFNEAGSQCGKGEFSFIDDASFVGKLDELIALIESIKPKLAAIGLRVNDSKCVLTCFSDLTSDQLQAWRVTNIPVNTRSTRMLGAAVARDVQPS